MLLISYPFLSWFFMASTQRLQETSTDSLMLGLQGPLSQLIYRFLASVAGSAEADRKTRLLLALLQDIHTSAYIMQHRTSNQQTDNSPTFPTTSQNHPGTYP